MSLFPSEVHGPMVSGRHYPRGGGPNDASLAQHCAGETQIFAVPDGSWFVIPGGNSELELLQSLGVHAYNAGGGRLVLWFLTNSPRNATLVRRLCHATNVDPRRIEGAPDPVALPWFNGIGTFVRKPRHNQESSIARALTIDEAPPCMVEMLKQAPPPRQLPECLARFRDLSGSRCTDLAKMREVSLRDGSSDYNCAALEPFCDKSACATRKFGVGRSEWTQLTIIATTPPLWYLTHKNGTQVFLPHGKNALEVRTVAASAALFGIVVPQKQNQWDPIIQRLIHDVHTEMPPPNTTPEQRTLTQWRVWASARLNDHDTEADAIVMGNPFRRDGFVLFLLASFSDYLRKSRFPEYGNVWLMLRDVIDSWVIIGGESYMRISERELGDDPTGQ